jgi:hypothetical protein
MARATAATMRVTARGLVSTRVGTLELHASKNRDLLSERAPAAGSSWSARGRQSAQPPDRLLASSRQSSSKPGHESAHSAKRRRQHARYPHWHKPIAGAKIRPAPYRTIFLFE